MRALAIAGTVTAAWMASIMAGSLMRATPPSRRMSAGTRSRAMTATAPASSAMRACSALTTSMMTPPLSISARPRFTLAVPEVRLPVVWLSGMAAILPPSSIGPRRIASSAEGDGGAGGLEMDPGLTGREGDRLAGGVGERCHRRRRGLGPAGLDLGPADEDQRLPRADNFGVAHLGIGS